MLLYILRRLLTICVLLAVVSFAVFALLWLAPGSVIDALLGTNPRTPQLVEQLRHEYHLDQPFLTQYWIWARDAIKGQFGNSAVSTLPVTNQIKGRLPDSLFLGIYAYVLTMVFGIAFGIWSALKKWSVTDRGLVAVSVIGLSTPAFVSGVFLLYIFAVQLPWFPVFGTGVWFTDKLWHLTLPAIALAMVASAYVMKHTRASMIGVLDQDYVTFARARGLSGSRVLFLYALRNAMIPVVTISGLLLSFVITGAVLVEVTFSIPGIGQLLVQSAQAKDLPMIQGVAIVVAAVIMLCNLAADVVYMAVDPRIRFGIVGTR
jgi:peptide/nickel transport system permease protein